ncbi:MAG: peptidase, partial [bacterium]|nr:peptidase [bacterium]
MEIGKIYHGFKLVQEKKIKEQNAAGKLLIHEKTGARLFKVESKDDDNTFCIAFKTPPTSDNGICHILEHGVLNGSKNFPVKRPMNILSKGSLNTFINAFTAEEFTGYPCSSRNDKDFFNLMHVYLDAVLFPRIYEEPKIFQQEAWHYELDKKDGELKYNGIVYNEMKGAFSSPNRLVDYHVDKILFPSHAYHYESGGKPDAIPQLTYEEFKAFHKKHYHPSNSYIVLYGDGNLMEELKFIDNSYLSKFERADPKIDIPLQETFSEMKEIIADYGISENGKTENQTYLTLAFVAGEGIDRDLNLALGVLAKVLVNKESSPLRRALVEAGIGKDVSAYADSYRQNIFGIQIQNANPEDKDKFKTIVFDTLKKVVETGLDKKVLEGVINRMEFRLREGEQDGHQSGVGVAFRTLRTWMFSDNPYLALEFEKNVKKLKTAITSNYLENIIQKHLLENNHAALVVLKPKKGLEAENRKKVKEQLAEYKKSLSDEELEKIIADTIALKEYQRTPDTPEALATMPLLTLKDIDPKAEDLPVTVKQEKGIKVLQYKAFTNNIIYQMLFFDMSAVPRELIPYASLLTDLLGDLNTKNYSYGNLDTELETHTGSFSTYNSVYSETGNANTIQPKLVLNMKAMGPKFTTLVELEGEILKHSKLDEASRLKELITQLHSRNESMVKSNGIRPAMSRFNSYLSKSGKYDELIGGLSYYRFLNDLSKNFDKNSAEIIKNLQTVASLIINKNNLMIGVVCSDEDYKVVRENLPKLLSFLEDKPVKPVELKFDFSVKNEGLLSASKVQYVIKGGNLKDPGYEYSGKMAVLNQILSKGYLFKALRVLGGA